MNQEHHLIDRFPHVNVGTQDPNRRNSTPLSAQQKFVHVDAFCKRTQFVIVSNVMSSMLLANWRYRWINTLKNNLARFSANVQWQFEDLCHQVCVWSKIGIKNASWGCSLTTRTLATLLEVCQQITWKFKPNLKQHGVFVNTNVHTFPGSASVATWNLKP